MEYHPTAYLKKLQIGGGVAPARTFHRTRFERFQSLYFQNLIGHYGCVNAIEFSSRNGNYLASGGDDKRVLLWNVSEAVSRPNYRPLQMNATHMSNIFCLAFNKNDDKLVSSGNDGQVILHDLSTNNLIDVFMCDNSVYGLSVHPDNDNLVAAACEDGTVYIMDTRLTKSDSICLARETSAFHSVMFSPLHHHLLVTSHSRDGMALWDIRSPKKEVLHYGSNRGKQRAMSARFNQTGNQLICLRRRLPLALYNVNNSKCVAEFGAVGYSNSCTMKSCCFAGDKDQYVVSGSDDFGVYIWKLPGEKRAKRKVICKPSKILKGHRSIVNQVRYNPSSNMLVSCGVEKVVKLWSTEQLPLGAGDFIPKSFSPPRKRYSHNEYLQLILESSGMTHDYESENTQEDPRMLAFFDSLVQHEADACETDSSNSDYDMMTVAQRNTFFVTGGEDNSNSTGTSDASDEEGPASLETLGIGPPPAQSTEKSEALQKKLRTLRARIKSDGEWLATEMHTSDSSEDEGVERKCLVLSEPLQSCSGVDLREDRTQKCDSSAAANIKRKQTLIGILPKKRIRLKKEESTWQNSDTDSDSAAKTRQRNARRRVRKPFRSTDSAAEDCVAGPSRQQNPQFDEANSKKPITAPSKHSEDSNRNEFK